MVLVIKWVKGKLFFGAKERKRQKDKDKDKVLGNKTDCEDVLDDRNSSLSVETPPCRPDILLCQLELLVQMVVLERKVSIS